MRPLVSKSGRRNPGIESKAMSPLMVMLYKSLVRSDVFNLMRLARAVQYCGRSDVDHPTSYTINPQLTS